MSQKPIRPQAHNLTGDQIEQRRLDKIAGIPQPKLRGNKENSYVFDAVNAHLVHVNIRVDGYSSTDGKQLHKDEPQMFYPDIFRSMEKNRAFQGRKVTILHDPALGDALPYEEDESSKKKAADKPTKQKPLDKMNEKELRSKYLELFEVEAVSDVTPEQLREFISEKELELQADKDAENNQ